MTKKEKELDGADDTHGDDREDRKQRGPHTGAQREYHEPLDNGAHSRKNGNNVREIVQTFSSIEVNSAHLY